MAHLHEVDAPVIISVLRSEYCKRKKKHFRSKIRAAIAIGRQRQMEHNFYFKLCYMFTLMNFAFQSFWCEIIALSSLQTFKIEKNTIDDGNVNVLKNRKETNERNENWNILKWFHCWKLCVGAHCVRWKWLNQLICCVLCVFYYCYNVVSLHLNLERKKHNTFVVENGHFPE